MDHKETVASQVTKPPKDVDHLSRLPLDIMNQVAKQPILSIYDLAALAATSRRNNLIATRILKIGY